MNQFLKNRWQQVGWIALILIALWLPRGLGLDRYATADENAWLTRSANFYRALAQADWAATFQRHHPGVTLTWAGTVGFLTTYPGYVNDADRSFGWLVEELTPFLRDHNHEPSELLAAGRSVVVLWIVLALTLTFLFAYRRWGIAPALVGMGLVAFDPFHIAHSRLMHLDGLLSTFLILSVVALLVALNPEEGRPWQWGALFISGIAAGWTWLTRSPGLFLLPFALLIALAMGYQALRAGTTLAKLAGFLVTRLLIWAGIGVVTVFLLWPAMWVAPWQTLNEVLSAASTYAAEGHEDPIFFNGTVYNGDPGFWFYPVTWLWRVTPVTLVGVLLALVAWFVPQRLVSERNETGTQTTMFPWLRIDTLLLLIMALGFTLAMNLGAKKFDRYLLPIYPALDLVAGLGWVWALRWVTRRWSGPSIAHFKWALLIPLLLVLVAQGASALPHYPYYLTYYNPLLGGSEAAPSVMQIGRGEGADRAARLLNRLEAEAGTEAEYSVASAFPNGPFSYFYNGRTVPPTFWTLADYAVVYQQDFQRRLPSPRQVAWFETLKPMAQIDLHGIDYAKLYNLAGAGPPSFVTTWATDATPQIRLNAYELTAGLVAPGETLHTTFYLENLAPIANDLNVLVRLVGADGVELDRSEGWPWGAPTSTWEPGVIWPDGHDLTIPATATPGLYRLELRFYDPETGESLVATQANTGAALGETVLVDFVTVGTESPAPAYKLEQSYTLGGWTDLIGYTAETSAGRQIDISRTPLLPGENLLLILFWQVNDPAVVDYTTFVHIVDNREAMLTQQDQPPVSGLIPTTLWRRGQVVSDRYTLTMPEGAALGTYQIYVGLYDPATVTRLAVAQQGEVIGDRVPLTRLVIALSRMDALGGE